MFSQDNLRTVMGTAQAGAVAIVCAARRGIPVALHTPSEAKAAVTGSGRADKAQVATMVTRLLRLADPPRPADTADALALAICHLWRGAAAQRLALAVAAQIAAGPGSSGPRARVAPSPPAREPRLTGGTVPPGLAQLEVPVISHLDGTLSSVAPDGVVVEVGRGRPRRAVHAGDAGQVAAG